MDIISTAKRAFERLPQNAEVKEHALGNLGQWVDDEKTKDYLPYIEHLIEKGDFSVLLDSFWRMIPFGTGGRRGPVGAGPNRINPHTISLSVQGHCTYLQELFSDRDQISVVVAWDVRQFYDLRGHYRGVQGILTDLTSADMAKASAMTYAANGIVAYIVAPLEDERELSRDRNAYISTPELSFLIRDLGCVGGLNISASHNHPDDNGGKFYNMDGGQEIPPRDEELLKIVETVQSVKSMDYLEAREKGLIRLIPKECHKKYISLNKDLCPTESRAAKIAFTPLCGTGTTTVLETLRELHFDVDVVQDQAQFSGSFETVRYRIGNPEVPDSMDKLEALMKERGSDIGFSTDPDADRLGVVVDDNSGQIVFLNGNEIGVLLLESILQHKTRTGTLGKRPVFINTLVTSSLQREIAKRYGCQVIGDLMVGFKYMGDVLGNLERFGRFPRYEAVSLGQDSAVAGLEDFVFTTEESHGYLLTPQIRDKDACGAAVHLAGLASILKEQGRTLVHLLRDIYRVYGYYRNNLRSLVMDGIVGLERIARIQEGLRSAPPSEIAGYKVVRFDDFLKVGGPIKSSTDQASRNVLLFVLDGGDGRELRLIVRPSGTEPKTKIYVEVPSAARFSETLSSIDREIIDEEGDEELDRIIQDTDRLADKVSNSFIRYCLGKDVLGDVYPEIPEASLLVSDLVTVDNKILFGTKVLPDFLKRLDRGAGESRAWLEKQLLGFGEDPLGLVKDAILEGLRESFKVGEIDDEQLQRGLLLFEKQ